MPKRPKKRKVKRKIRLKESAKIVQKNDATRVGRIDTLSQLPTKRVIPDNGATFKIKIRKK